MNRSFSRLMAVVIQYFRSSAQRGTGREQNELFLAGRKQIVSVPWLSSKSLQITLLLQEGWDCKRLGAFKPRQSSSDKRMELEVMAQEGKVWIMGDKHSASNSV